MLLSTAVKVGMLKNDFGIITWLGKDNLEKVEEAMLLEKAGIRRPNYWFHLSYNFRTCQH